MQTLDRSYLLRSDGMVAERLQFLYMRVAIGIYGSDMDRVLETYELLSTRKMSLASPVLWNGGLANRHYASCYIFQPFSTEAKDAVNNFAGLSALWAANGGIGIHAGEVPATRYALTFSFRLSYYLILSPSVAPTMVSTPVSCHC